MENLQGVLKELLLEQIANGKKRTVSNGTAADQRKAAEAVVAAAICCQALYSDEPVSEEVRARMVEAVLEDPLVTADLFLPHAFRLM